MCKATRIKWIVSRPVAVGQRVMVLN